MTHTQTPADQPGDESPEFHLPAQHWPLPELSTVEPHRHPEANRYVQTRDAEDFQKLRKTFRSFAFPTVIAVLVWYFVYVIASTYATGFMGAKAVGNLTIGMVIGLLQFPTTWLTTWFYVRYMNAKLDPLAASIRSELEAEEVTS